MVHSSILLTLGLAFTSLATPAPSFNSASLAALCASQGYIKSPSQGNHQKPQKYQKPQKHQQGPKKNQGGGSDVGKANANANAKAIYFISNAAKNEVVALKVGADGMLSDGSVTATGGCGGAGVDAAGLPALPDGLFSQGSIKIAGNALLAVNAGSNTLSMFSIDAADPTKLTLVGKPVDTLGEFPVSVAASSSLKMACVANSGAKAGISCFSMDSTTGLTALDTAQRPIELGQTTPPVGPTNTVSHIFFNSDSTALLTTVKGDPPTNKTGFLSIFPVVAGKVSTKDTRSTPAGTAVLFGTALIPNSKDILVTDASFGSGTLAISANNTASLTAKTAVPGQAATCWAAVSALTGSGFVTDVAVNHLVEVDTKTGTILSTLNSTNGNPGMIDLATAGKLVYALSPGNNVTKAAVAVFDIGGGKGSVKEIQNFALVAGGITAQGMALII